MAKKKRKVPGLNGSSMADISFTLLIFFLITTSMDTDMGLARRLPKPPEENQEDQIMDIKARNILYVRMNAAGELCEASPCGACRQVLLEAEQRAGGDIEVLLYGTEGIYAISSVKDLLPLCFELPGRK